jgi:uncharacterized membrane protein YhaH (DUF805 family)
LAEQLAWVFFSLRGRLNPGAYFLAGLLLFVIQLFFIYRIAVAAPDSSESESWALSFLLLAIVCDWANFAITAKRFHDFDKPTAFALIALIAFFIGFILVVALSFVKGDPGRNRYGATTNAPG